MLRKTYKLFYQQHSSFNSLILIESIWKNKISLHKIENRSIRI